MHNRSKHIATIRRDTRHSVFLLREWMLNRFGELRWQYFYLDIVASGTPPLFIFQAGTQPNLGTVLTPLTVTPHDDKYLESHAKILFDVQTRKGKPWNKLRLVYRRDSETLLLRTQWDQDLAWFSELSPDEPTYLNLDIDMEMRILSWQGLPLGRQNPGKNPV